MWNNWKYRLTLLLRFRPLMLGVKKFFVLNVVVCIMVMLLSFVTPRFYQMFIDQVILNRQFSSIYGVVIGYLGVFILTSFLEYFKKYLNNRVENRVNFRVKRSIWKKLFGMDFEDYETYHIGDMKMRLEDDTEKIRTFFDIQVIDYLISFLTFLMAAIFLFLIDWRLALFSLIFIPLTFGLDHMISKREKVLNEKNRINDQNWTSWLHATIQGWREVKTMNLEKDQMRTLVGFVHKYTLHNAKWLILWVVRVLLIPRLKNEFLMQFGLYFFGGILIMSGRLSISALLIFAIYFKMLDDALQKVSTADAELQSAMPFFDRILQALHSEKSEQASKGLIPGTANTISFQNVGFMYPESEQKVIDNLSFTITKGQRIAITGESGAGKTTILKLMTGLLKPTEGLITFSGIDLKNISIRHYHEKIGFVMQQNFLFNTTIRENLQYGNRLASEKDMIEACEKAYIYDLVKELPEQFDTIIGEKGLKLSGGQRQRLVLARLFLRDVDIFIFDEATSALDQYSESIIHDAIESIAKEKTIIIVAHRQSSIDLCEDVIQLKPDIA